MSAPLEGQIAVSVIIPAKNEQEVVGLCLESVLAQKGFRDRLEIVLSDNGSCDHTASIAEAAGAQVLRLPDAGNVASLRNAGASAARGEVLAFLDADMRMPEQWLEHALGLLAQGWHAVALVNRPPSGAPAWLRIWESRNTVAELRSRDFLTTQNLVVSREAFDSIGGFDQALGSGEDKDFTVRLSARRWRCALSPALQAEHLGAERTLVEFSRKEWWRQREALALAAKHGFPVRLVRFPVVALAIFWLLLLALVLLPVEPRLFPAAFFPAVVAGFVWGWLKSEKTLPTRHKLVIGAVSVLRFCIAGCALTLDLVRRFRQGKRRR